MDRIDVVVRKDDVRGRLLRCTVTDSVNLSRVSLAKSRNGPSNEIAVFWLILKRIVFKK